MKKWPKLLKNKFVLTSLVFIIWVGFFDNGNSIGRLYSVNKQVSRLQSMVDEKKIENESIRKKTKMLQEKKSLEKFAREEFRFKKPNEEIFVIVADE